MLHRACWLGIPPAVWASLISPRCQWPPHCQGKHNSKSSISLLPQFERCGQNWPDAVLLAALSLGAVLGPALSMCRATLTRSHAENTRLAARMYFERLSKQPARVSRLAGLPTGMRQHAATSRDVATTPQQFPANTYCYERRFLFFFTNVCFILDLLLCGVQMSQVRAHLHCLIQR